MSRVWRARHQSVQRLLADTPHHRAEGRGRGGPARAAVDAGAKQALTRPPRPLTQPRRRTGRRAGAGRRDRGAAPGRRSRAAETQSARGRGARRAVRGRGRGQCAARRGGGPGASWWTARRRPGRRCWTGCRCDPGYEKALGAALADDLRAPEIAADGALGLGGTGGLRRAAAVARRASTPLAGHVAVPAVLRPADRADRAGGAREGARVAGRAAARSAAGQPRGRPVALGRVPRRGRRCAFGRRAAAAAVEPAGAAEARSGGGGGAGRRGAAGP